MICQTTVGKAFKIQFRNGWVWTKYGWNTPTVMLLNSVVTKIVTINGSTI